MRKPVLYALAAIAVLGSCTCCSNSEAPVLPVEAPVFTATIDADGGEAGGPQHAVVVPGSETGKMKVNWESDDQVRMDFYTSTDLPRIKTYVSTPAANPTQTTLTLAPGQSFEADIVMLDQACYPASLLDAGGFPAEQTYQGVDQVRYAPMYYYNTTYQTVPLPESLTFHNAAALLKITVSNTSTEARTVRTVSVASDNKKMNGRVAAPGANTTLTIADNSGTNTLTLNCGDGVSIPAGGSSVFYIIVPPATYGKLTFTVTYTDNTTTSKSTKDNTSITIERNKVYPISISQQ